MVEGIELYIVGVDETSFGSEQNDGKLHCPRRQCIVSGPFSLLL